MKKVGKILLLVSGIALVAIGVWELVVALMGLAAAVAGAASGGAEGLAALVAGIVLVVVGVILLLFYFFAGLRGIKTFTKGDHKNVTKAFIWAIIILALNVFSLIYTRSFAASTITALVIDAAYVTGAFMVKLSK